MGKKVPAIVALAALAAGCSSADGYVVYNAVKACEQHQGIHHMYPIAWEWHVQCNDGNVVNYLERRKGQFGEEVPE